MKKTLFTFIFLLILSLTLVACNEPSVPGTDNSDGSFNTAPEIVNYYLNEDGDLVVEFDNGQIKNLGSLDDDFVHLISSITTSADGFYIINGVKTNISAFEVFSVQFETGASISIQPQMVKQGGKADRPNNIERDGYTFAGWFYNGEEWSFNSGVVDKNMTLIANWIPNNYVVSFETETSDTVEPITATFGSNIALPSVERAGYTFEGWYYEGEKISGDNWSIAEDCKLLAKWTANEYTITINPNGGTVSQSSVKVEYGKDYILPVATIQEGAGNFVGWFYNDIQLTDEFGNSLTEWNYAEDIEVTTTWIIELSSFSDLQKLHAFPNGHFELTENILMTFYDWTPIGTKEKPFSGIIDGNGYLLGLLPNSALSATNAYGLIGYANNCLITDLTIRVQLNIPAISADSYAGGLIGYSENSTIKRVDTSYPIRFAEHSADYISYAGGLIGYSRGDTLECCSAIADATLSSIRSTNYAGGLVGYAQGTTFTKCLNEIPINSDYAGGIAGYAKNCTFTSCKNSRNITGRTYSGGIAGHVTGATTINQCINEGIVSISTELESTGYAGGIVGQVKWSNTRDQISIKDCYNTASVSSEYSAGGIVGSLVMNSTIKNCYSFGDVSATNVAGGIVGFASGDISISQCLTATDLTCPVSGTIVSSTSNSVSVSICYYIGTSTAYYLQGNQASELTADFYTNTLFWDDEIWDLSDPDSPKLIHEQNIYYGY